MVTFLVYNMSMKKYAPTILRVGLSTVILWFGYQQIAHTSAWVGYLPDWTTAFPIQASTLVYLNGLFEIVFGLLLLTGLYVRISALLLALHLFEITFTVGYTAVGVRDFGLSVALLSIFFYGADFFTLDRFFKNR